ncbi:SseB family protein [Streptomyces sp. MST-110588]|uniref:SseB family protein n=1 Tax=Streptomyces sp. MST-110588 TaxID=2833628 RepID=UPI001F5CD2BA|nr:SseB family protein [Streptomyces sp. MST-110588]UNO41080.1 SseB family protein [Streptomyces sp. MST-110588]
MALADEIAGMRAGNGNPAAMIGEFRRTPVLVPLADDSLMSAEWNGIRWLLAFSDEDALMRYAAGKGLAPGASWEYVTVRGARLLDVVIPAIEGPTGVALDAGSEHGMVFPPLKGIVPEAAALDRHENGDENGGRS